MKQHVLLVHEGIKPFKCPKCDYANAVKQLLQKHIDAVHEDKRPCLCSYCGKGCKDKAQLKVHVTEVHEGIKPHMCTICGHSFSRQNRLRWFSVTRFYYNGALKSHDLLKIHGLLFGGNFICQK